MKAIILLALLALVGCGDGLEYQNDTYNQDSNNDSSQTISEDNDSVVSTIEDNDQTSSNDGNTSTTTTTNGK
jgi:hypothetical protein